MPQIGPLEILVVSVIALIVFGPQRLPEIARSIGRALNEFKRQASDIRSEFESGLDVADEPEHPGPIVHKGTTGSEPKTTPIAKLPDTVETDRNAVASLDPDPDATPRDAEEPPRGSPTHS